jgi:hypothetical protein
MNIFGFLEAQLLVTNADPRAALVSITAAGRLSWPSHYDNRNQFFTEPQKGFPIATPVGMYAFPLHRDCERTILCPREVELTTRDRCSSRLRYPAPGLRCVAMALGSNMAQHFHASASLFAFSLLLTI